MSIKFFFSYTWSEKNRVLNKVPVFLCLPRQSFCAPDACLSCIDISSADSFRRQWKLRHQTNAPKKKKLSITRRDVFRRVVMGIRNNREDPSASTTHHPPTISNWRHENASICRWPNFSLFVIFEGVIVKRNSYYIINKLIAKCSNYKAINQSWNSILPNVNFSKLLFWIVEVLKF